MYKKRNYNNIKSVVQQKILVLRLLLFLPTETILPPPASSALDLTSANDTSVRQPSSSSALMILKVITLNKWEHFVSLGDICTWLGNHVAGKWAMGEF